jgi:hypothetical protein
MSLDVRLRMQPLGIWRQCERAPSNCIVQGPIQWQARSLERRQTALSQNGTTTNSLSSPCIPQTRERRGVLSAAVSPRELLQRLTFRALWSRRASPRCTELARSRS